jgi:hypothetical protein
MALYRFLFAPVLLAVAVFHGGERVRERGGAEQRAPAAVEAARAEVVPGARPVPAAARASPRAGHGTAARAAAAH